MAPRNIVLMLCVLFCHGYVQSQELSSYRWSNRLILVIADDPNSAKVKQQISLFANDSLALNERKLLILQVFPQHYLMGQDNSIRRQTSEVYFDYKQADQPFQVVLIGMDGSEKLRKNDLIMPSDLYAIIDSMPMRRSGRN